MKALQKLLLVLSMVMLTCVFAEAGPYVAALIIVSATAEIWGQRLFSERLVFLRDSNAKSC